MDLGLADSSGKPLPTSAFGKDPENQNLELIGSGSGEDDPQNVDICPSVDNATLHLMVQQNNPLYSHGAVTASLVAGGDLIASPDIGNALPRILFYRLNTSPCPPHPNSDLSPTVVRNAIDYLGRTESLISASLQDTSFDNNTATYLGNILNSREMLVIVPSGTGPTNLDRSPNGACPVCLRIPGSPNFSNSTSTRLRLIVVGAANRSLNHEDYSNYGARTVQIYAPGAPSGALDLLGGDASGFDGATSYAAPFVARAIALVESLAHFKDFRDRAAFRVMLSTWPYFDDHDQPIQADAAPYLQVGVLDLTKVAAVRTYAVEAMVREDDGVSRRHTYVGDIIGGIAAISQSLCAGSSYSEKKWQALMFDQPGSDHQMTLIPQKPDTAASPPTFTPKTANCQSSGTIHIIDLRDGDTPIPVESVTLILAPLRR